MEVVLYSIDDLIEFLKTNQLEPEQLKTLLADGYNVYIFGHESINSIIAFFEKYRDSETMPIFVHNPLDWDYKN